MEKEISIHAPRGGSDWCSAELPARWRYFNPRSPWGERHNRLEYEVVGHGFQSTLPVGGATCVSFR